MAGKVDPLTIVHVDAERSFSGGEEQVFLLIEGLRRRGHRNLLFCPPGSRSESEACARGIETRGIAMRGDLDLGSVLRLKRAFLESGADLVHLHTGRAAWLGGLACYLGNLRAVVTRRMDRAVRRGWRSRLVYGRFVRRAVAISPAVAARLGGVGRARVVTIPSAVDPASVHSPRERAEIRRALGLSEREFVLLTLASLVHRKGLDLLIEALARLAAPDTVALVAGEGPERGALEALARRRGVGDRVRFLGRREDKAELLKACDVLVLPSRHEGLGVAALEAMAASRPVIAGRVGGLAEAVVHQRTGILFEADDIDGLARAIEQLRADPELASRLGGEGPARVAEGHLPEQMVGAYERLYREVLTEERDGRSLSACIVAMDEEHNIAECLDSVAFCDEIIVVDSHSTDRTREIAREHGARVIERDWPGFGAQKEFAIREAQNDWVLCLDADESVSDELRREIEALRARGFGGKAGWRLPRLSNYLGTWVRYGWYPNRQLRLFDRRRGRWGGNPPHERVLLDGPRGALRGNLLHHPYRTFAEHLDAIDRYTTTMARGLFASGRRTRPFDLVFHPCIRFLRFYLWKRGFLLGTKGLLLAYLTAHYVRLKYAKLYLLQNGEALE